MRRMLSYQRTGLHSWRAMTSRISTGSVPGSAVTFRTISLLRGAKGDLGQRLLEFDFGPADEFAVPGAAHFQRDRLGPARGGEGTRPGRRRPGRR